MTFILLYMSPHNNITLDFRGFINNIILFISISLLVFDLCQFIRLFRCFVYFLVSLRVGHEDLIAMSQKSFLTYSLDSYQVVMLIINFSETYF